MARPRTLFAGVQVMWEGRCMPTRQLVLVRHAKAEPDGADDVARPLTPRGRQDAAALGRWMAMQRIAPDLVVVSSALRARQTWEIAVERLGGCQDPVVDDRIYQNTVDDLLAVLRAASPDVATLVLVGHIPAVQDLVSRLDDGAGASNATDALRHGYPAASVAVLEIRGGWDLSAPASATLIHFVSPSG
jgi:phosphohistidine phosphatase